jgi:hypothetical protein
MAAMLHLREGSASVTRKPFEFTASVSAACMVLLVTCFVMLVVASGVASAATPGVMVNVFAAPTHFSASADEQCASESSFAVPRCDAYEITVVNDSNAPSDTPLKIEDSLPTGVTATRIAFEWSGLHGTELGTGISGPGEAFCHLSTATCELPVSLEPDQTFQMFVYVAVGSATGQLKDGVTVTGESINPTAASTTNEVSEAGVPFGVSSFDMVASTESGSPDRQAGDHPYELTTMIDMNSVFKIPPSQGNEIADSVKDVKDVVIDLPIGFLGSANASPKCALAQLASPDGCPSATVIGHLLSEPGGQASINAPIYDMVPEHGVAAEFGFVDLLKGTHVLYGNVVPSVNGYVLETISRDVPQVPLTHLIATFYGDPASKDHSGQTPVAFFTNPMACTGAPVVASIHVDSWQNPGPFGPNGMPELSDPRWVGGSSTLAKTLESPTAEVEPVSITGCNALQFAPESFSAEPESRTADSSTGLVVDIKVDQPESPGTLATPPLKQATVTLPAGLTLDPSVASGLAACSASQVGWLGGSLHHFDAEAPRCPDASKVGAMSVLSPLLEGALSGSIYLAQPFENPYGARYAVYLVVDDPQTGVVVKIPGEILPSEQTGQLTGVFEDSPQFPFSDLTLHFFGGVRGDLATPRTCGGFITSGILTPWSAPDTGPGVPVSSGFDVDSGCIGGFSPEFTAGTESTQAGAYSPFKLSFSRADGEEYLGGLTVNLPDGLLAKVAGVQQCSDAQLAAAAASSGEQEEGSPSCPAGSEVGTVQAASGPGPFPFVLPGKVYFTGPYDGGPYGLAVVVPALAGPFDLGTVVVRASIRVDPTNAHVTVVSDPLPTILKGVVIRLRRVDVTVDRPDFTFNPTNCTPLVVGATFSSLTGRQADSSSRFAVGGCRELRFRPTFAVSTQGRASKRNGASLHVTVKSGPGQANIAKVHVTLPRQLPSRLETLNKACLAAVFESNPANCPSAAGVGTAKASTPVLSEPLLGTAYLVSHGGEKFPDLDIVLKGDGVTVILTGNTAIKNGITTSTFNAVPDVPVTTFELTLPEGPHSVLGAVVPAKAQYSLCSQDLTMPTIITGQNGAVIRQATKITETGCSSHHKKAASTRKHRRRH